MTSCRAAFAARLLELARDNPDIMVVATDSRGSTSMTDFARELPAQFVEAGIAEQDAVGLGAGLANAGKRPFMTGPASFYSLRSADQVKIDLAYNNINAKVIAVSGGVSYGMLGTTHHATQDVALMRAIPNMTVIIPADGPQSAALADALAAHVGPVYVRMGRGPVPDVYAAPAHIEIGRANLLRDGRDLALIANGELLSAALDAAERLARRGISARVLDMHTVAPLDEAAVLSAARDCGAIMTVEEHCVRGGLGAAVAELCTTTRPVPMDIAGLPCEPLYNGASADVFEHYALTPAALERRALALLERKGRCAT